MYFIFSKLLYFLIVPLNWIVALFALSFVLKNIKLKYRCRLTAFILLLVFSNPFLLNTFARLWDVKTTTLSAGETYSCAIILGGFSSEDSKGNGFFNGAADRFIEGLKLYKTGRVKRILVSGGNGSLHPDEFAESSWVSSQLKQMQVPDSGIVVEHQSRNTRENAAFSYELLAQKKLAPPYVLVTSAFHMRRALYIFRHAGMNVVPYSCDFIAGNGKPSVWDITPSALALTYWDNYIKEVIGYGVAHLQK